MERMGKITCASVAAALCGCILQEKATFPSELSIPPIPLSNFIRRPFPAIRKQIPTIRKSVLVFLSATDHLCIVSWKQPHNTINQLAERGNLGLKISPFGTNETPMKTPKIASAVRKITGFATVLIVATLFFSSCEKSNLEYIATPVEKTTSNLQNSPAQVPMNFTLVLNHCFAGGAGVSVNIDNPQNYAFLWEVNGNPGGHSISTSGCDCGGTAKVTVTRLSDGQSMSKSVNLLACNAATDQ